MTRDQQSSQTRRPLTYGLLAPFYFDEAARCIEHHCFVAAIAMSWAAVDHAVAHELLGGRNCNPHTLRPRRPVGYNPKVIRRKLRALWSLFPRLAVWEDRLLFLYEGYRNTFLHGKLTNIAQTQLAADEDGETTITHISPEDVSTPKAPDKTSPAPDMKENIFRLPNILDRESYILMACEPAAHDAYKTARDFLSDLNRAISETKVQE